MRDSALQAHLNPLLVRALSLYCCFYLFLLCVSLLYKTRWACKARAYGWACKARPLTKRIRTHIKNNYIKRSD